MAKGTATQSDQLALMLRQRIVTGEFPPGRRLPTFQEIESQFRVSRCVAQTAVSQLKEDGFLRPKTGRGLYVSDHPPHLRRYGLVFPMGFDNPEKSRFDEAMVRQMNLFERQSVIREFEAYAGATVRGEKEWVIERLKEECRRDRLAGLILVGDADELSGYPPFDSKMLPKVFVFHSEKDPWRPFVTVDSLSMVKRGLEWLANRGRRRVAIIRISDYGQDWNWKGYFEQAGLEFHPQWVLGVGRCDPSAVQTLIPLLMDYPAGQRPDGVFIIDDNLVDYTAIALASQGCKLGEDLDIVAHCNWPTPEAQMLPMRRIGFHVGHMLERCIDVIDMQRRGETPPEAQRIPARFEDELAHGSTNQPNNDLVRI